MNEIINLLNNKKLTTNVYLIENIKDTYKCIQFPNELNDKIKNKYISNFINFTEDRKIVDYDNIHYEKGTIQKVCTDDIDEWGKIKESFSEINSLNKKSFSNNYKLIVINFEFENNGKNECISMISKYKKVDTWYKNSFRFCFLGEVCKEFNEEIFVLNGCIDCLIYKENTFILVQNSFESLFKYDKKMRKVIEANKENIEKYTFIDEPLEFYEEVLKNKKATKSMARFLLNEFVDLRNVNPKEVRATLDKYEQFSSLKYNDEDKIIIDKKSRDIIINILRGVYLRNLFEDKIIHTKGV